MSAGKIANALSDFRLIASVVISLFIVFTDPGWWWFGAVVLTGLGALSEGLDGWASRRYGTARDGKQRGEVATGFFSILLPVAILLWLALSHYGFLGFQSDLASTENLAFWVALCLVFGVGTLVFNRGKARLVPHKAERYEVYQAWFTALIIFFCAWWMFSLSWMALYGQHLPVGIFVMFLGVAFILCGVLAKLTGDRFYHRYNELDRGAYKGTKQHLFGRR